MANAPETAAWSRAMTQCCFWCLSSSVDRGIALRTGAVVFSLVTSHAWRQTVNVFFELCSHVLYISLSRWTNFEPICSGPQSCRPHRMFMRNFPLGFIFHTSRMEWLQRPRIPTGDFHVRWDMKCLYLILVYLHRFSSQLVYFTSRPGKEICKWPNMGTLWKAHVLCLCLLEWGILFSLLWTFKVRTFSHLEKWAF